MNAHSGYEIGTAEKEQFPCGNSEAQVFKGRRSIARPSIFGHWSIFPCTTAYIYADHEDQSARLHSIRRSNHEAHISSPSAVVLVVGSIVQAKRQGKYKDVYGTSARQTARQKLLSITQALRLGKTGRFVA
jgi:hypothetical protein